MSENRQRYGMSHKEFKDSLPFEVGEKEIDISKEPFGQVVVRVVKGGARHDQVWYPVIRKTRDGEHKASWDTVNVDSTRENFFTGLAAADLSVKREHLPAKADPSKLESQFDPSTKYMYLVIPRKWSGMKPDDKPVMVMRVPWQVHKSIQALQEKPHPTKSGVRLEGPVCLYDVVIEIIDKGADKPKRYRRGYPDVVALENKWQGKCPDDWADDGLPPDFDVVENKVFTEEERDGIDALIESDALVNITRPASPSEISIQLGKTQLNLWARRDGAPVFEYPDELAERLHKLAVPLLTHDQVTKLLNDLPGPVDGDHKPSMPEGPVQDAEEVPEEESQPEEQKKSEPKTKSKRRAATKF